MRRVVSASDQPPPPLSTGVFATVRSSLGYLQKVQVAQPEGIRAAVSGEGGRTMLIKFIVNEKNNPPGKLADAEIHFTDGATEAWGPLTGLKLCGFCVWERRGGTGRNVTFPARQYSVNGERRSFALLRPALDTASPHKLREIILVAYQEFEEREAIAS